MVALAASACGPAPSEKTTPAPPTAEELRSCPHGDKPWADAVAHAEREGGLKDLGQLAQEVAAAHADRWEPLWTAGDCLVKADRSKRVETYVEAAAWYERALERAVALDDAVGMSRAANSLAWCRFKTRDPEGAEALYDRAFGAARRAQREDLLRIVHSNRAALLRNQGRLAEALDALAAASQSLGHAGSARDAFALAYLRGLLLGEVGQFSEQRQILERLYSEAPAVGQEQELPKICVMLGNLYALLGEPKVAREWYGKVSPSDVRQARYADLGLGRLALREGRWAEAASHLDRADVPELDPTLFLYARAFRAEVDLREGRVAQAVQKLRPLVAQAEQDEDRNVVAIGQTLLGKALMHDPARAEEAARAFQSAVVAVEGVGAGLNPEAEGMTYLRERIEPFPELAAALSRLDGGRRVNEVFDVVERAHARVLRQLRVAPGREARVIGASALRRKLARDELLLDYLIGEDRGVVVAQSRDTARVELLPGWSVLRPLVNKYTTALKRPLVSAEARLDPEADLRRAIGSARKLRHLLIGPVEDLMAHARRVFVVPDQDLALLPFAALPLGDGESSSEELRFLGGDHEIAVLPMAGEPPAVTGPRAPILLAGDPLPDERGEYPALEFAARELGGVEAIWAQSPTTRLDGARLTANSLRELPLASFGTLHFATHALASSRDPRRCAVILSAGEKLSMQQIAEMRLGPALIVLSACKTGEGEVIPGEGVVGLTWAFLRAGAQGVVASLWSVVDESTTELMVAFHRNLRSGADPVRALSLAQRELARKRPHPLHWASFVVVLGPEDPS